MSKDVHFQDDFILLEQFVDQNGKPLPVPDCDWRIDYYTEPNQIKYTVSYIGGKYTNCKKASDSAVLVSFNNHNLGVGALMRDFAISLPNALFGDGTQDIFLKSDTGCFLVEGATAQGMTIDQVKKIPGLYASIVVAFFKGDKGDPGDGIAGRGISKVTVNSSNNLIITYTDGTTEDAGRIAGGSGTGSDYILSDREQRCGKLSIGGTDYELYRRVYRLSNLPTAAGTTSEYQVDPAPLGDGLFLSAVNLIVKNSDGNYWPENYVVRRLFVAEEGSTKMELECVAPLANQDGLTAFVTLEYIRSEKVAIEIGYHTSDGLFGRTVPEGRVLVNKGDNLTVKFNPAEGYEVERFNVDTQPQELATEYTFVNVQQHHTIYVWFKKADEPVVPNTDFLQRSDNDTVYSSLHNCLKAVTEDYPNGLTRDVTVICTREVTEKRNPNDPDKMPDEINFVASLTDWNKDTTYVLTIDGAGKYTLDCNSLGGVKFDRVDNVVLKNISFIDVATQTKYTSPEEMAAIIFLGTKDRAAKNLYVDTCSINGAATSNAALGGYYQIITKFVDNIYVVNSTLSKCGGLALKFNNSKTVSLVRNSFSGMFRDGLVGHGGLANVQNACNLYLEDNIIDGAGYRESLFYLTSVDRVYVRRNQIYGTLGRPFEIKSNASMRELVFEANLFRDNLHTPLFEWIKEMVYLETDIEQMSLLNNTVYFNGSLYLQYFVRAMNHVGKLTNLNNIYIDATGDGAANAMIFVTLGEYVSGSNLYKAILKSSSSQQFNNFIIIYVKNPDDLPDSVTIAQNQSRNLSTIKNLGFESNSNMLDKASKVLNIEAGENGYGMTAESSSIYKSSLQFRPEFDLNYNLNSDVINIGAISNYTEPFDEAADQTAGYTGIDIFENAAFSNAQQFGTYGDNVLIIKHNTKNRTKFIKTLLENQQHKYLGLGRYAPFVVQPVLDANGEYVSDQLFDINIDSL